jgi:two-component system, NarL family, sensor kinase
MIQRLGPFHWHGRPFRFRDRLLAGMLAVSLLPLALFAVLVAADLGSVSNSTVDEANRSILQDQAEAQLGRAAAATTPLQVKLAQAAAALKTISDRATDVLAGPATAGPVAFATASDLHYATSASEDDTVIAAGPPTGTFDAAKAVQDAGQTASLVQVMHSIIGRETGIQAAWVADTQDTVIRLVPAIDVPNEVSHQQLDPRYPLGRGSDISFSAIQSSPGAATVPASDQADSRRGSASPDRKLVWTDTYATSGPGGEGVTAWGALPVGNGHRYRLGVDIDIGQLTAGLLAPSAGGEPGAYPILLSAQNRVLATVGDQVRRDFPGLPAQPVGAALPLLPDDNFNRGLADVEQSARPQALVARLGGVDKQLYTATVPPVNWVLAVAVPSSDLLPRQASLTRGIGTGVHRILLQVVPIAVALCAFAFVLATILARRLVGPVRALTAAAERLADGHTEEAVPRQGEDEVGLLADSLERMRREVNASRDAILAAARELEVRVADRTAELRDRNEELLALNALAGSLTRSLDPATLLTDALSALRAFLPVSAGRGYHLQDGRLQLLAAYAAPHALQLSENLAGAGEAAVDAGELIVQANPVAVLVGLPLATAEGALGAMAIAAPTDWQLAERTSDLLRAVADQVALALHTAKLSAEGRELAVLEERTRLAREIHDTLAQQLTGIVLQLEAAEALVDRDQRRAHGVVVAARDLARNALQEARRSVWNLRPAPLEATGLPAAVQFEARRWSAQTRISAAVDVSAVPAPLTLAPQEEVALFRIVQEALSNCARHSNAHHVDITLVHRDSVLEMAVSDDGQGFDADGWDRPGSFGLVGMAERARLIGATLEIEGSRGQGTTVRVRLPLAETAVIALAT